MALNFQQLGMLAKLKSAFSTFQQEHPKFMPFIHAVKGDACRKGFGTYPDAERYAGKPIKYTKAGKKG